MCGFRKALSGRVCDQLERIYRSVRASWRSFARAFFCLGGCGAKRGHLAYRESTHVRDQRNLALDAAIRRSADGFLRRVTRRDRHRKKIATHRDDGRPRLHCVSSSESKAVCSRAVVGRISERSSAEHDAAKGGSRSAHPPYGTRYFHVSVNVVVCPAIGVFTIRFAPDSQITSPLEPFLMYLYSTVALAGRATLARH
jgi:hypothetical protein